jgi:hypothetical protein
VLQQRGDLPADLDGEQAMASIALTGSLRL